MRKTILIGCATLALPGATPAMAQSSFVADVIASTIGVHLIHNALGRTIEDLGGLVNGNEVYVIGNPGGGELGKVTPTSGATAPFAIAS